ncbi:unnamed protein product [Soboliphyme baturini]|uniref:Uncharacterized protein n=1 Tax=Soboliphyme baturini TaxID=241478 RepID=A0A183IKG0_9BILA|nr:unnamed protein product [Soboliphyme baturini]
MLIALGWFLHSGLYNGLLECTGRTSPFNEKEFLTWIILKGLMLRSSSSILNVLSRTSNSSMESCYDSEYGIVSVCTRELRGEEPHELNDADRCVSVNDGNDADWLSDAPFVAADPGLTSELLGAKNASSADVAAIKDNWPSASEAAATASTYDDEQSRFTSRQPVSDRFSGPLSRFPLHYCSSSASCSVLPFVEERQETHPVLRPTCISPWSTDDDQREPLTDLI